ncbi:MAG: Bifunctional oligoribonuclease and PAP phosphatase NrnA [bacterium ADurb.Bin400]|nr:MAG: Bifunctional oligoribonuclease and PAP phosphatase NrnA [bacterium ADurb.Bin400]
MGSLIALYLSLHKMGKDVVAVCNDTVPQVYGYLKDVQKITHDFHGSRDFIISLDVTNVKADKVMCKTRGNSLDIIITPKSGRFEAGMVSFPEGGFNYEAIIVLDSTDLERLGSVYERNAELFYELPVVNIDHHPGNSHFGKVNLVDLTATSTSEILVGIIEALSGDPKFIDEPIATSLLTGIIADTNSFQNANTTPKSLTVAAQLVAAGARQQDIVRHIYKTKPLSTLRLWGRALSNLRDEKNYRFVWSVIHRKDYLEVGASENESGGVIDELLKTASGADFALLLSEKNNDVHGSLRATNPSADVSKIAKLFGGGGHPMAAAFQINKTTLLESSEMVIQRIREYQRDIDRANQLHLNQGTSPVMRVE